MRSVVRVLQRGTVTTWTVVQLSARLFVWVPASQSDRSTAQTLGQKGVEGRRRSGRFPVPIWIGKMRLAWPMTLSNPAVHWMRRQEMQRRRRGRSAAPLTCSRGRRL
ncbi:hypothetical protein IWX50DRAFT_186834 [Phyllosticta citricarpa]